MTPEMWDVLTILFYSLVIGGYIVCGLLFALGAWMWWKKNNK